MPVNLIIRIISQNVVCYVLTLRGLRINYKHRLKAVIKRECKIVNWQGLKQTRNDTLPCDNIVEARPWSYDRITGGSALKFVPVFDYNKPHV